MPTPGYDEAVMTSSSSSSGRHVPILELGRGGMADVKLAVARGPAGFNKLLVVKTLLANIEEDPDFVAMFLDEARLAARLNHPNVVVVNEVGEQNGRYFLAMEYLDGQPLQRVLARAAKRGEAFPRALWLRILCDALNGLHYAHELKEFDGTKLNVVHRDVTPENVFITYDGVVKLVDFGIAKAVGRTVETKMGVVKGKIGYLSPEQARAGHSVIDRRTDIFAAGVMIWEASAVRRFWAGANEMEILHRLNTGNYDPSPRTVRPEIPEALDAICRKALAHDVDQRYATAAELQKDLDLYLTSGAEPRVTSRDAADWIAERFAKEREKTQAAIEQALAELKRDGKTSGAHLTPAAPPAAPPPKPRPETPPAPVSVAPKGSRSARQWPTSVGVALTIAGLALLGGAASRWRAAQATAVESGPVTIRISARPDDARFKIGDGPWLQNPHAGSFPRSTQAQTLRIEAPGHASRELPLVLDRDRSVRAALGRSEPEKTP
jgi:serine/threonine protein kinase